MPTGEQIPYATLLAESKAIEARLEREERAREYAARQLRLQNIRDHQEDYWQQVELAAARRSSTGYDEAVRLLVELREAAAHFKSTQEFQDRFHAWVRPYSRLPGLTRRLREREFTTPKA